MTHSFNHVLCSCHSDEGGVRFSHFSQNLLLVFFDHVDKKKMMTRFFILRESETAEMLKLTEYEKNNKRREKTVKTSFVSVS